MSVVFEQKAPLKYITALEPSIKCLTTGRKQYTLAHRHNTGGFGTPMLVLLLSIFQHRRRAGYRTGQTHSCLRLPPLWMGGGTGCLTNTIISHHIQSAPSCLFLFFLSQPLIQSAAPGCPHSWALAGGWGPGRPWSQESPLLWRH